MHIHLYFIKLRVESISKEASAKKYNSIMYYTEERRIYYKGIGVNLQL